MMNFLVDSPVAFINGVTPLEAHFVVFCATTLGILTAAWVLIYLLVRPIPDHCAFAPFENIGRRIFDVFVVFLSAFVAYVLSVILKNYFQIGRPVLLNFNLHPLLTLSDYGFPSGHASFFSALAVSLFLMNKRAGVFAIILALVIGAARIFAGVHTPLDILGGYLLGTLVAVLVDFIAIKIAGKPAT